MEWLAWLSEQAKTASPFVAVFCLGIAGLLWRQHIKDLRTREAMGESQTRALLAVSRNLATLSALLKGGSNRRR